MKYQQERIKTPVVAGERENLEPVTTRLTFSVTAQLDGLARAKRQSRSLYLARLISAHVREPRDD
jgi:hypothetical protein